MICVAMKNKETANADVDLQMNLYQYVRSVRQSCHRFECATQHYE